MRSRGLWTLWPLVPETERIKMCLTRPYREILYLAGTRYGKQIRFVAVFDTFERATELGKGIRSRFGFAPSIATLRYTKDFDNSTNQIRRPRR